MRPHCYAAHVSLLPRHPTHAPTHVTRRACRCSSVARTQAPHACARLGRTRARRAHVSRCTQTCASAALSYAHVRARGVLTSRLPAHTRTLAHTLAAAYTQRVGFAARRHPLLARGRPQHARSRPPALSLPPSQSPTLPLSLSLPPSLPPSLPERACLQGSNTLTDYSSRIQWRQEFGIEDRLPRLVSEATICGRKADLCCAGWAGLIGSKPATHSELAERKARPATYPDYIFGFFRGKHLSIF